MQKLILPIQIKFAAHTTGKAVQLCKAGVYEHWMGMVIFGPLGVGTGRVAPKFLGTDGKPTVALDNSSNAPPVRQRPSDFFKQRMFYWKGQFYTRKDTIEMHANALGGVHFDMRRTQKEAHIIELKNYLGFEVRDRNIQMLIGQDVADARSDPSRRTNIYDATELLTLDTGRIFSEGVLSVKQCFTDALMSNSD